MKNIRNNPDINRKYNYLYKLTNKINNKIYIGVHRTDKLDDGYMGSGIMLKRAKNKYGIDNFEKNIIKFFDTYKEALDAERIIVNMEFISDSNNYNVREGGFGNCKWSPEMIIIMSNTAKELWNNDEHRLKMGKITSDPERNIKIGKKVSEWIKMHPDEHKIRMDKINKNPDKIKKTADKHRGMKRTETTKKNVSNALKELYIENPALGITISGRGSKYIYNPLTQEIKRISKDEYIIEGWIYGSGPKNKESYKDLNSGSFFGYDPNTLKVKRFKKDMILPEGWVKGRPKGVTNGRSK